MLLQVAKETVYLLSMIKLMQIHSWDDIRLIKNANTN